MDSYTHHDSPSYGALKRSPKVRLRSLRLGYADTLAQTNQVGITTLPRFQCPGNCSLANVDLYLRWQLPCRRLRCQTRLPVPVATHQDKITYKGVYSASSCDVRFGPTLAALSTIVDVPTSLHACWHCCSLASERAHRPCTHTSRTHYSYYPVQLTSFVAPAQVRVLSRDAPRFMVDLLKPADNRNRAFTQAYCPALSSYVFLLTSVTVLSLNSKHCKVITSCYYSVTTLLVTISCCNTLTPLPYRAGTMIYCRYTQNGEVIGGSSFSALDEDGNLTLDSLCACVPLPLTSAFTSVVAECMSLTATFQTNFHSLLH